MTEATDQVPTKHFFELEESAGIGDSGQDRHHPGLVYDGGARHDVEAVLGVERGVLRGQDVGSGGQVQRGHHVPGDAEALLLVPREVILQRKC